MAPVTVRASSALERPLSLPPIVTSMRALETMVAGTPRLTRQGDLNQARLDPEGLTPPVVQMILVKEATSLESQTPPRGADPVLQRD